MEVGVPRLIPAGVEHDVANESDSVVASIEVELKY